MSGTRFEIRLAKSTEWSPTAAAAFWKSLMEAAAGAKVHLNIRAFSDSIRFTVGFYDPPTLSQQALTSLVHAYYPTAQIIPYKFQPPSYPFYRSYIAFARTAHDYAFLTSVTEFRTFDPLTVVSQTMAGLQPGETLTYTVRVYDYTVLSDERIKEILTYSPYDEGERVELPYLANPSPAAAFAGLVANWLRNRKLKEERRNTFSDTQTRAYEAKLKQRCAYVWNWVMMETPHKERLNALLPVAGAVCNLAVTGETRIVHSPPQERYIRTPQEDAAYTAQEYVKPFAPSGSRDMFFFYLTPEEVATLWHLPHSGFATQPIVWAEALPSQVVYTGQPGAIHIGHVDASGTPVALSREDRQYHGYVTGQTGMGKSTMLHNLIHQDIAAGEGVAVLDPHGSLIADILTNSIPVQRLDDVVLVNCADREYPAPINPFRTPPGVDAESQFAAVMWLMKSIYAASWSETRMETTMRNILQLILSDPQATPLDIQEIVQNPKWRQRLFFQLEQADKLSRSTVQFWKHYDELSPSDQNKQTQPILNRLSAFLGSPHLERVTCHPETLDFRALIRGKKIVLINLAGDVIAPEVETLGAIFFINIFLASHSLFSGSGNKAHRFYLYVDEAQRFIATALPQMFSEARKYGLSLTLANQYIGQLNEETREAIKNNVGTKVSFECSPDEARLTARLYEPDVEQQVMTRLGLGRAAIRTRFGGDTLPAFVVRTLPPPAPTGKQVNRVVVAEQSRKNLKLLPSGEVKAWIDRRYEGNEPPPPTELQDFE